MDELSMVQMERVKSGRHGEMQGLGSETQGMRDEGTGHDEAGSREREVRQQGVSCHLSHEPDGGGVHAARRVPRVKSLTAHAGAARPRVARDAALQDSSAIETCQR